MVYCAKVNAQRYLCKASKMCWAQRWGMLQPGLQLPDGHYNHSHYHAGFEILEAAVRKITFPKSG